MLRNAASRALVVLGFAAAVAQAVLLREAMAALGGSELAWGCVLTLWLAGMGAGSRLGVRCLTARAAAWLPAALLTLAASGVLLLRAAPTLAGTTAGEPLTTLGGAWVWVLAVLPAAVAGGLAFPALAGELGDRGAGHAYALEAAGALVGGVAFTFALAPFGTAATLAVAVGLSLGATLLARPLLAIGALAAALVVAATAGPPLARASWRWAHRPGELAAWAETRQQQLALGSGSPAPLYADGRLLAAYPDPYVTVPRAHLVMLLHPRPTDVLLIGGLADGSLVTMLRHPVARIDVVEPDPALLRLLPRWYGGDLAATLADPRVRPLSTDPARALTPGRGLSLVVALDADPTTLRLNRTRTLELFRACRDALAADGILVVRFGVSDTYLGGGAGRLLAMIASTLREVFPKLAAIPGESVLLVAGREEARLSTDVAELARRWAERRIADPAFSPELLTLQVDPDRRDQLEAFVGAASAPPNTTARPRAVLLAAGLAEGRTQKPLLRLAMALERYSEGGSLLVLLLGIGLLAALVTRLAPAAGSAAVVGFASMAWWLLLLASWQATLGSVYSEVGALSGALMAGLAGGALLTRGWQRPARKLPVLLAGGIVLSGVLASPLPAAAPRLAVPLLLLTAGGLTGAAFGGLADLAGHGQVRRGAGLAFAADEVGAAAAAFLVGVAALPVLGLALTSAAVAVAELAAIVALLPTLRRG